MTEVKNSFFLDVKDILIFSWLRNIYEENEDKVFYHLLDGKRCSLVKGKMILSWVFIEYFEYLFKDLFTKDIISSFLMFLKSDYLLEKTGVPVYRRREKADRFLEKVVENYGKERLSLKPVPMATLQFLNERMERYARFYCGEELLSYMKSFERINLIDTFSF